MITHTIKLGDHKWTTVIEYQRQDGGRYGLWCADDAGGWGTHSWSITGAIDACSTPHTYRTQKLAKDHLG